VLEDTKLVWQVVECNAGSTDRRLDFLRRHSGRVLALKPCDSGNCRWARNLTRDATALPAGIASGNGGPKDWEGYWRAVMAPRWGAVLELAEALANGEVTDRPCSACPRTWGGPMDHEHALTQGLFPMGCQGVRNDGFAFFWFDGTNVPGPEVRW